jgi:hypothetical protein
MPADTIFELNFRSVAVRLAGDSDLEGAVAGKPDCYGVSGAT